MQVKDTRERLLSSVHREQGKVPARAGGGWSPTGRRIRRFNQCLLLVEKTVEGC